SQLFDKTDTLDLERVVDHQGKYRQRHAHGDIDVGGGDDFLIMNAGETEQPGNQIHRNQIHQVHQENPDKDRQGEGSYEFIFAVERVFNCTIDKFDNQFNKTLQ